MRFKFYLFISLITHLNILIFSQVDTQKQRLKGEKITPIEIINNQSFNSSRGNTNKNSLKKLPKKIQDEKKKLINKENKIKDIKEQKFKDENVKGDFQIKKKEINDKTNIDENGKGLIKENQIKKKIKKKRENNPLIKEKKSESSESSNAQKKGFSNIENNKDIEKGSVKGKGKIKITCLNCISPKYPRKALQKGLEGKPIIKVWILKSGYVEKVELIISSGITSIDNAALDAGQKSRFYPLQSDTTLNIEYELKLR